MKNNVYILFVLIFCLLISCGKLHERAREREKKKGISGIVVNKYNDNSYNGRVYPILTVINGIDTVDFNIFGWYTEFLWEYVKAGDSISKPPDTLLLTVFKPFVESKSFEYYDAPETIE